MFALIIVLLWITAAVGWVINLVDVIKLAVADSPITTLFIAKAAGILFAPLGSILGLFF
jgi:hypothetical protein